MTRKTWPHQMRINSKDELVFDPLTRWEVFIRNIRSLLGLPIRSGVVSRELSDE